MLNKLQEMANEYGFGLSVQNMVSDVYSELKCQGFDPCIVNDRYIEVEGVAYQFRKTRSKGHWTVSRIRKVSTNKREFTINYKLCTLLVTDSEGWQRFQTVVLNGNEFRQLIAAGAELVEIIE